MELARDSQGNPNIHIDQFPSQMKKTFSGKKILFLIFTLVVIVVSVNVMSLLIIMRHS